MAVSQVFGENWGVAMVVSEGNSSQISEETSRKASEIAYHGAHVLPGKPKSIEGSASVLDSHSVATLSIESIQPPVNAKSAYKPIRDEAEAGGIPELEGSSIGDASAEAAPPPVSFRVVRATGPGVESREGGFSPADAADREIERLVSLRRQQERRWDEFVVGVHNKMAWTGAEMVLDRPGQVSPLLIHGPHGVGKTHLAVGLSQRLKQRYQYRRVLFTTGEQFTIEYSESARNGGFASFRKKYRDLEVLVIDDLQFCLGKTGTLVELRNTIEALIRDNRQIILVSDRSAHDLGGLGSDLNARIQGGMTCSIDPMDCQTRRAL